MQSHRFRHLALAGACAGLSLASTATGAAVPIQYADALATRPAGEKVNIRLIDLGFTAGTGFDDFRNTVEVNITVTAEFEPTNLTLADLDAAGLKAYSQTTLVGGVAVPNLTSVQGLGDLPAGTAARSVNLSINEAAIPGFDYSKLKLQWTGVFPFPVSGVQPDSIQIGQDIANTTYGFFDVAIGLVLDNGLKSSKLLFSYDDPTVDLGLDLFGANAAGHVAMVYVQDGGPGFALTAASYVPGSIAPVPEPSTYATLGLGLAGLALALRRRRG